MFRVVDGSGVTVGHSVSSSESLVIKANLLSSEAIGMK